MMDGSARRLTIVIHSLVGGGAERVTVNLANFWASKGWTISVITIASCTFDFFELHPAVKRISLDLADDSANIVSALWKNLHRVIELRRVLRKLQPDVVIGMMTGANVILALATVRSRFPVIGSEHVHPPQYTLSNAWEALRRHTYGRLDAVVALTHETAHWLEAHTKSRRIAVIPNAAPWPLPVQEPKVDPGSICLSDRHILLAVGRFEAEKGFDLLLNVFAEIAAKHPTWDLVILGEGPLRVPLTNQAVALGLAKRVFFPGRVGNIGDWYECTDIYVMSSRFEGFGNTLAEALAYGVPVVSFDCDTGPRNIIRNELDGLLVPAGDVAQLTMTLDRMMGDSDLRRHFAEHATDARERFSVDKIAQMWEELFDEVAS